MSGYLKVLKTHIIVKRCASSQKKGKSKKYSHTICLPKTNFPLWLKDKDRILNDEKIEKESDFKGLYNWQRNNAEGPEYVLHDGPPYANGPAHIGHAINKIIKDIAIRYKLLNGHKIHFKPGWDCHGLPIELKALSSVESNSASIPALDIRKKAKDFAVGAIEQQKNVFKTWGILADWDNECYYTFDKKYVQNQIKQFYNLYKKKFIYRDLKPVHWSPSSRTALAEAELEYNKNHVSKATTLRFRINPSTVPDSFGISNDLNLYGLIWTTTPWTLPTNRAVAFSENFSYSVIKIDDSSDVYLVASDLVEALEKLIEKSAVVLSTVSGETLSKLQYEHPFHKGEYCPFVAGVHVSSSKGTGLVHCAPAHGPEDFVLGLKYKLSMNCIVNELGCYTEEAGENLKGLDVLSTGNDYVLSTLQNDILHIESFQHSYPYDWRTKKPIIVRASEQWFIDTESLKENAIKCLQDVNILPKANSERLKSMLETRPFWCISRQRVWGVPIPVLYDRKTGDPIINDDLIDHYCNLIERHGTDFWWKLPVEELLPEKSSFISDDIRKGEDILDIWFDSGTSWSSALEGNKIADLYLEGIDQCSGWFQSSLLTSVGIRNSAPFKNIFIHGFAVDQNGHKMSKSLGNVVDPQDIIKGKAKKPTYGIDVLRWWVASHAVQHSQIPVTENTFITNQDSVQRLRHIIKFLLGNLNGFDPNQSSKSFWILDKFILNKIYLFHHEVQSYYQNMQLNRVCATVSHFIANDLSALYLHWTKDRLYCDAAYSDSRVACQEVCFNILEFVLRAVAPMVPHLAEETYSHHPLYANRSTYFRNKRFDPLENWNNNEILTLMKVLFNIKEEITRLQPTSLKPAQLSVDLELSSSLLKTLKSYSDAELLEILQIADFQVVSECSENFKVVNVIETKNHLCERCRRYTCVDDREELCFRCSDVVNDKEIISRST